MTQRASLILVAIFALTVLYAWRLYAPCDDAYIYLVYAKNFLNGNGLTFNGMKVQGFTSPLWTTLLVLFGWLPVSLPQMASALSLLAGFLVLVATHHLGRAAGLSPGWALAPPFLVAVTGDFAFYSGNGLETVLFTGMVLFSLRFCFAKDADAVLRSFSLPLLLSVTILTRPEGVLIAVIVLFFLVKQASHRAVVLRCLLWMMLLLGPVVVGLRLYYGGWLPNTYWAKAEGVWPNVLQGIRYSIYYLFAHAALYVLMFSILVRRSGVIVREIASLLAVLVIWIGHVTLLGGDNMVGGRMMLPVTPIAYVIAIVGLRRFKPHFARTAVVLMAFFQVVVYNAANLKGSSWDAPVKRHAAEWRQMFETRKAIGLYLKENLKPGAVVALNAAGIIPFFSELPTIDMLGLNNVRIARQGRKDFDMPYGHQTGDGSYVWSQKPDVIIFGGAGAETGTYFLGEREFYRHPEFADFYQARDLPLGATAYFRIEN